MTFGASAFSSVALASTSGQSVATGQIAQTLGVVTQFGSAHHHAIIGHPDPINNTLFGTPTSSQYHPVTTLGIITRFGTPVTDYDQTCVALGFCSTRVGQLVYSEIELLQTSSHRASGFRSTAYGTPTGFSDRTVVADGFTSSAYGTPRSVVVTHAESAKSTAFGAPMAGAITYAQGFKTTGLGSPTTQRTQFASSTYRPTRFGLPRAVRPDCYQAHGVCTTRLGHPRLSFAKIASSVEPTVAFGLPSASFAYRAQHIPPTSRVGKPRLIRTPLC